ERPAPIGRGARRQFRGGGGGPRLHEDPLRELARRSGGTSRPPHATAPPLAEFFRTTIAIGPSREEVEGTLPQSPGRQELFFAVALALLTLRTPVVVPREWVRRGAARLRTLSGKPVLAVGTLLLMSAA